MPPNSDPIQRAVVIALRSPHGGKTTKEISQITGLPVRSINRIYARAVEAGFEPNEKALVILPDHVIDKPRSGRPKKQTAAAINAVTSKVSRDRYGREKNCADIAGDLTREGIRVSATTVWRILRTAGYRKTKPTRKPGLTAKMKAERLAWCLQYKDWTLEDWKKVIWSDETSVVLLHRRGGYRLWRRPDEAFARSCIRERWKGYSEFMFWGCFSYELRGPCHCWMPESAKDLKLATEEVAALNAELEPIKRAEWEFCANPRAVSTGIDTGRRYYCLSCSHTPTAAAGMLSYKKTRRRPTTTGNSPDINPIEPCWPWMKRYTTRLGAPKSRAEAIRAWEACWKELKPERFQPWIERIPRHIQEIIRLEGGNEYKEGRNAGRYRG
ncbi:unnamed protein product [Colletotrichum noveboracense]|uniref:Transposase Tc1-like domain-containing protein n=1 Tax=Colletotrichum noveboracense TaxID=2664923 RepID=A0A9W4RQU1_9PEZI|nr:unnamed protein product [Colletotrichum noveboracense]